MERNHHLQPTDFFTPPLPMSHRSTLSATGREQLLALPESPEEFIRQYTLGEADLSLIHQHRGAANRLGFAVQICYLRFPGVVLGMDQLPGRSRAVSHSTKVLTFSGNKDKYLLVGFR